ncbi:unnamed protein product [Lactuca virosa]|uniref:Uncharacterized protein n=1 Tax=Lactuca virosa TaxID=75947 RepID=A0AAU9N2R7_9ASTR|nr:unnamed protein product [Lactuca virosa]
MQRQVVMIDLPKYKEKVDRFGADLAIKGCIVNNPDFDPDGGDFLGGSTPHLKKIAMRILSLTSSSSGVKEIGARLKRYIRRNEIDWRQID